MVSQHGLWFHCMFPSNCSLVVGGSSKPSSISSRTPALYESNARENLPGKLIKICGLDLADSDENLTRRLSCDGHMTQIDFWGHVFHAAIPGTCSADDFVVYGGDSPYKRPPNIPRRILSPSKWGTPEHQVCLC